MKGMNHLVRAGILALLVIVGFTVVRFLALPESWGKYGHYRADAVAEEMAKEPVYQGAEACKKCHGPRHEEWSAGKHGVVNCENCHGQAKEHVAKPGKKTISVDRSMDLCLRCHRKLPERPHDFTEIPHPQIDPQEHLKGKGNLKCFNCHKPHHPDLKRPEEETAAKIEKRAPAPAPVEKETAKPAKKTEAAKPTEKKAESVVTERARSIYTDKCLVCHGEQGKPADFLSPKPPDFSSASYKSTPAQTADFIRKGKGQQMPAYGQELSDEEIKELAEHIQSFRK